MIPAGVIGGLVAAGLRSTRGGRWRARNPNTPPARIIAFAAALVLLIVALVPDAAAWRLPASVGSFASLAIAVPTLPTALFVRFGWVRPTLAVWRISGHWNRTAERRQAGAFHAARALLRAPDEAGARRIERYLLGCVELATYGAAATALVALARGDRARAVAVGRALDGLWSDELENTLVRWVCNLRALDAAARGDWRSLTEPRPGPRPTRLARLLRAIARSRSGEPTGSSRAWRLWLAWAFAPSRRRTRSLVQRALARPPLPPPVAPAASFAAHAALLARVPGEVRAADLDAAIQSLAMLRGSGRSLAELQRRAMALASGVDAGSIQERVCADAEDELVKLAVDERLPLKWIASPAGNSVRARVLDERLERLEALVRELGRRAGTRADLAEADEWRSWGDVRIALDDLTRDAAASGTPAACDAIFRAAYPPLTSYAVRLCNVRSRRVLARLVFLVVRDLARMARAGEELTLCEKNVAACDAEYLGRAVVEGEALSNAAGVRRHRVRHQLQLAFGVCAAFLAIYAGGGGASEAVTHAKLVMVIGGVIASLFAVGGLRSIVDLTLAGENLVIQTHRGRFPAQVEDLAGAEVVRGNRVRLELRRTPRWMSRRPVTVAASPADAQALAGRLNALRR